MRRNRGNCPVCAVISNQVDQIEVGQYVSIGHQESIRKPRHLCQRTGCAERFLLIDIINGQPQTFTIGEEHAQEITEIAYCERHMADTRPVHLAQDDLKNGFIANGH